MARGSIKRTNPVSGDDHAVETDATGRNMEVVVLGVPGSDSALTVFTVTSRERNTYVCNTGPITGATSTGTKSLAYLWHQSSDVEVFQVIRVAINQIAGAGGAQRLELRRITAENGTPGGSTGTIFPKNPDNPASAATIRIAPTGAPTRQSGAYQGTDVPVGVNGNAMIPAIFAPAAAEADEFTCRTATNEGWEITQEVTTAITTAPVFNITWEWVEY